MTASFVQSKGVQATTTVSSISVTLTSSVSLHNHLNSSVAGLATTGLTTSSPSATWANAVADFLVDSAVHIRADYSEDTASGTWTVTGNPNSGTDLLTVCASESAGVALTASIGATNHGISATTTCQPGSITPAAGSVIYAAVTDNAHAASTTADTIANFGGTTAADQAAGAGTVWDETNVTLGTFHYDNAANSALNPTVTTTHASVTGMGVLQMEFKAAAAGGAQVRRLRALMGVGA